MHSSDVETASEVPKRVRHRKLWSAICCTTVISTTIALVSPLLLTMQPGDPSLTKDTSAGLPEHIAASFRESLGEPGETYKIKTVDCRSFGTFRQWYIPEVSGIAIMKDRGKTRLLNMRFQFDAVIGDIVHRRVSGVSAECVYAGWPFHSMSSFAITLPDDSDRTRTVCTTNGWWLTLNWGNGSSTRLIPIRPIWRGLALNWLWLTVTIFIIIMLIRHCRAMLRGRCGLCRECGYNLSANVAGRCPECGTVNR